MTTQTPTKPVSHLAQQVQSGDVELLEELPTYERTSQLRYVAPLDRPYTALELKALNEIGGGNLYTQAHLIRVMFFAKTLRIGTGEPKHYEGVQLFYSRPIIEDGVVIGGSRCADEQIIVADIEQMRKLLAPANLQFRQPLAYEPNDYGEKLFRGKAVGNGQTFVAMANGIVDIRTSETHNLGLCRWNTLPQVFGVVVQTQEFMSDGATPRAEKILYERYFSQHGIHSYAAVDWLMAHLAIRAGESIYSNKIRRILDLSHRRPSQDGTRMVGYDHDQVVAFLDDLEAFEKHRADSRMNNFLYWEAHPKKK
ncbi:MAG TPA: hypothetical protein VH593_08320 [Ktedonobacteraceae bacterium]